MTSSNTNNKQSLKQLHLDFGQRNIGLITCQKCGMVYQHQEEDEKTHRKHCRGNNNNNGDDKILQEIESLITADPLRALDKLVRYHINQYFHQNNNKKSLFINQYPILISASSENNNNHNNNLSVIEFIPNYHNHHRQQKENSNNNTLPSNLLVTLASIPQMSETSRSLLYSELISSNSSNKVDSNDAWKNQLSLLFVVANSSKNKLSGGDGDGENKTLSSDFESIVGVILFSKFSRFVATEIVQDDDNEENAKQEKSTAEISDDDDDDYNFNKNDDDEDDEPGVRIPIGAAPIKEEDDNNNDDMKQNDTNAKTVIKLRGTTSHGIILDASPLPPPPSLVVSESSQQQKKPVLEQKSVASFFSVSSNNKTTSTTPSSPSFFGGGGGFSSVSAILNKTKTTTTNTNNKKQQQSPLLPSSSSSATFFKPTKVANPGDRIRQREAEEDDNNNEVKDRESLFYSCVLSAICSTLKLNAVSFLASRTTAPFAFANNLLSSSSTSSLCVAAKIVKSCSIINKDAISEREVIPIITAEVFDFTREEELGELHRKRNNNEIGGICYIVRWI